MTTSNTDVFPLVDLPPAFSIKNANGAHSYKYLNLAGFLGSPKHTKTPSSFMKIWHMSGAIPPEYLSV